MFMVRRCRAYMKASEFRSLIVRLPALLAVFVTVAMASGQASQPIVNQTANARVDAGDYSLHLVVDYKNNKPVLDLKPEEITISEDYSPVKLGSLRLVSGKSESNQLITLVFDRGIAAFVAGQNFGTG